MSESLLNCEKCYLASKQLREPFALCSNCTDELDRLKIVGKSIQVIDRGPYRFQVSQEGEYFKVELAQSSRNDFHTALSGSFLDLKHCIDSIESWLKRPFKMAGSQINIF